jgi:hypothetical protein
VGVRLGSAWRGEWKIEMKGLRESAIHAVSSKYWITLYSR